MSALITQWLGQMDDVLVQSLRHFGRTVTYGRSGIESFSITAIPNIIPRLESVDRGKFYSVTMRLKDFDASPLRSFVTANFGNNPQNNDTITFDAISYICKGTVDDSVPYQFLRGATLFDSANNLVACINADPNASGVTYSSATSAHPLVSASNQGNLVRIEAIIAGPSSDGIVATESMYGVQLSRKLFLGGGPLNGDTVTLTDGLIYNVTDIGYDSEGGIELRLEVKSGQV